MAPTFRHFRQHYDLHSACNVKFDDADDSNRKEDDINNDDNDMPNRRILLTLDDRVNHIDFVNNDRQYPRSLGGPD